jgi:ketosteroid isomerase-like protein
MITRDEVLEAEKEWAQAHLETDINKLDRLMHPDYIIIRPDGSVWSKEKALTSYIPGKRDWEEAGSSEHIINIYGHIAIVIGLWRAKGVNNGVHFDYYARYSSVWVKDQDELRIVSDHSTEIDHLLKGSK